LANGARIRSIDRSGFALAFFGFYPSFHPACVPPTTVRHIRLGFFEALPFPRCVFPAFRIAAEIRTGRLRTVGYGCGTVGYGWVRLRTVVGRLVSETGPIKSGCGSRTRRTSTRCTNTGTARNPGVPFFVPGIFLPAVCVRPTGRVNISFVPDDESGLSGPSACTLTPRRFAPWPP
jgi:hypothetical protein